jgi:hypothetical protein
VNLLSILWIFLPGLVLNPAEEEHYADVDLLWSARLNLFEKGMFFHLRGREMEVGMEILALVLGQFLLLYFCPVRIPSC